MHPDRHRCLSRGRETCVGRGAEPQITSAANKVNRRILLMKIPHCGVRREQTKGSAGQRTGDFAGSNVTQAFEAHGLAATGRACNTLPASHLQCAKNNKSSLRYREM